jgi:DNA-directed RNA polymerase subunit M/transcription elongation factor TFIIS
MATSPQPLPPASQPLPPAPREPLRAATLKLLADVCVGLTPTQVRDVEIGVFNWALERGKEQRVACNWANPHFCLLYRAKAHSTVCNLDPAGYVGNDRLLQRLVDGEFPPHRLARMQCTNVHPERWRHEVEMKMRRDEYVSNAKRMAMTDQFRCAKCKKRECSFMELQMRSCDEPATLFINCLSCGHHWRLG